MLKYHQIIRPLYIGPGKPGAFQLLKDWMSYPLPEKGREQALYLTNYAITRSLLYALSHWHEYIGPRVPLPDIILPNLRHGATWPLLTGYFEQLVQTYTFESIPKIEPSSIYLHFTRALGIEVERILEKNLDNDEELAKLHSQLLQQRPLNLPHLLAVIGVFLYNSKRGELFNTFYTGILLGKIPADYILNLNLLKETTEEILWEDQLVINIKSSAIEPNFNFARDHEAMKDESEMVNGLMVVLYDIIVGRRITDFKSKFYMTKLTKENSINLHNSYLY
eukprot:TRINITY_DN11436_c0_g1_i1.p1 TRINITY_DN11436_c0_g1~~TRINITY_DN11436_c0_g1_i1.p1  ORF type:complete len:279 (+),score=0.72 TRINITY_DN11436_c0_g1_i1:98-934(+)